MPRTESFTLFKNMLGGCQFHNLTWHMFIIISLLSLLFCFQQAYLRHLLWSSPYFFFLNCVLLEQHLKKNLFSSWIPGKSFWNFLLWTLTISYLIIICHIPEFYSSFSWKIFLDSSKLFSIFLSQQSSYFFLWLYLFVLWHKFVLNFLMHRWLILFQFLQ